jgi:plastocyanin
MLTRTILRVVPLLIATAALIAACGGDDDPADPGNPGPFEGTVTVLDNRFSHPAVTVAVGDSVTWRWQSSNSHSVTQGTTPDPSQDGSRLFDSGIKNSGTFGYRFTSAGTVPYFCRPHFAAGMKGTVTVQTP